MEDDLRNFKIVIQYEGTRYQGWQRQGTTQNTLQGKFEALLSKIAGTPVEIQASGRTDAGVHALGQTANFHMNTELSCEELLDKLLYEMAVDIMEEGGHDLSPVEASALERAEVARRLNVYLEQLPEYQDRISFVFERK